MGKIFCRSGKNAWPTPATPADIIIAKHMKYENMKNYISKFMIKMT